MGSGQLGPAAHPTQRIRSGPLAPKRTWREHSERPFVLLLQSTEVASSVPVLCRPVSPCLQKRLPRLCVRPEPRWVAAGKRPCTDVSLRPAHREDKARPPNGSPRWGRQAKGEGIPAAGQPWGAGPGGAAGPKTSPRRCSAGWGERVPTASCGPRHGRPAETESTPRCHVTQNTRPPCDPKSRLYLSSLIDTRTQCLKPRVHRGHTGRKYRTEQTAADGPTNEARERSGHGRDARNREGQARGDVRVVMKAKPKPRDHAEASTGGGAHGERTEATPPVCSEPPDSPLLKLLRSLRTQRARGCTELSLRPEPRVRGGRGPAPPGRGKGCPRPAALPHLGALA